MPKQKPIMSKKQLSFLLLREENMGMRLFEKNGDVCRCDYDFGLLAIATKEGTIKTFWNLKVDCGKKALIIILEEQKQEDEKR